MVETDGYQEISRQEYERKTRNWEYKFCFIPHQCLETGKWLWLKNAYRGEKRRRHDMAIFTEYKWMAKDQFIKLRLLELV